MYDPAASHLYTNKSLFKVKSVIEWSNKPSEHHKIKNWKRVKKFILGLISFCTRFESNQFENNVVYMLLEI